LLNRILDKINDRNIKDDIVETIKPAFTMKFWELTINRIIPDMNPPTVPPNIMQIN